MDDNRPKLTYKVEVLTEALQEELTKRQADREAKKAELDAKNKKAVDAIVAGLAANSQFLIWLVDQATKGVTVSPTSDAFAEKLASIWPYGEVSATDTTDPDEDLNRLIRVYGKAEDKTVEVSVNDEVYRYL
jgi:hypothetical protein